MTRQSRHSAPSLHPSVDEALRGPRRGVAGSVPGRALPASLRADGSGILWRQGTIAICTAHVLNSLRAPIASLTSKLTRHERGPNRGANRRRVCTEARRSTSVGRQRASRPEVCRNGHSRWEIFNATWCIAGAGPFAASGPRSQRGASLADGRSNPHRAKLCRPASSRRAPLS